MITDRGESAAFNRTLAEFGGCWSPCGRPAFVEAVL